MDQTAIEVWCGRCDAAGRTTQFGVVLRDHPPPLAPALWPDDRPFPDQEILPLAAGEHLSVLDTPAGQKVEVRCPKCARELGRSYAQRIKVQRLLDVVRTLEAEGQFRGAVLVTGDRQVVARVNPIRAVPN